MVQSPSQEKRWEVEPNLACVPSRPALENGAIIHPHKHRVEVTSQEPCHLAIPHEAQSVTTLALVLTSLSWTPSPRIIRLIGICHVLTELIAAGAQTRLLLLEKVGLAGQRLLKVKSQ